MGWGLACLANLSPVPTPLGPSPAATTKPNYLLVTAHKDRLELNLKEIDLVNGKGRLWQKNKSKGPWNTITITAERKKQGFTSIGKVTINKEEGDKKFETRTGFFIEKNNPK